MPDAAARLQEEADKIIEQELAAFRAELAVIEEEYRREVAAIIARVNERYLAKLRNELTSPTTN